MAENGRSKESTSDVPDPETRNGVAGLGSNVGLKSFAVGRRVGLMPRQ